MKAGSTKILLLCGLLGGCADEATGTTSTEVARDAEALSRHHHPKPDASVAYATKNPYALAQRERRVREIYENLVYPTPVAILQGTTSVDHIFEPSGVKGRVTPVGQFPDFNAVVEYFYALAVTPGSIVDRVSFRSVIAGDDKVAVSVDIHFCRSPDQVCDPNVANSATSQTLTQVGFFTFNRYDRVISMDLNILNLGVASDPPNDPLVHAAVIQQLCTALTVAHLDPTTGGVINQGTCTSYFDSVDDFSPGFPVSGAPFQNCVAFMQSIPFGSWNRANSNSVTCRQLHTLLTAVDPDMHCPHASPDGGGACVDFSYGSYYDESF
jgi:hypothetical protein